MTTMRSPMSMTTTRSPMTAMRSHWLPWVLWLPWGILWVWPMRSPMTAMRNLWLPWGVLWLPQGVYDYYEESYNYHKESMTTIRSPMTTTRSLMLCLLYIFTLELDILWLSQKDLWENSIGYRTMLPDLFSEHPDLLASYLCFILFTGYLLSWRPNTSSLCFLLVSRTGTRYSLKGERV